MAGFFSSPTIAGAAIGGADAIDSMEKLKLALAQQAFENNEKLKADARAEAQAAAQEDERKQIASLRTQQAHQILRNQIPVGADITNNPDAIAAANEIGAANNVPAQAAVAGTPPVMTSPSYGVLNTAPTTDENGNTVDTPEELAPGMPSVPAQAAKVFYSGDATQQLAAAKLKRDQEARQGLLDDPNTPADIKSFVKSHPDQDVPYQMWTDAAKNDLQKTIADNNNNMKQQLIDIKNQFGSQLTGLQMQLLQAKIDALNAKTNATTTVGIDSDTKYTSGGVPYVDGSKFHGKDYSAAQKEAHDNGVFFATANEADALNQIDIARKNMAAINESINKLPNGQPGTVTGVVKNFAGGLVNRAEAATGYDPDLATFKTNTDAAVQAMKAVAGTKGLRLNKDLIKASLDNNTPLVTDPQSVARTKYNKFMKFLDDQESTLLGTSNAGSPNAPGNGGVPAGVTITRTK